MLLKRVVRTLPLGAHFAPECVVLGSRVAGRCKRAAQELPEVAESCQELHKSCRELPGAAWSCQRGAQSSRKCTGATKSSLEVHGGSKGALPLEQPGEAKNCQGRMPSRAARRSNRSSVLKRIVGT